MGTVVDKIISSVPLKRLYQIFASACALPLLVTWHQVFPRFMFAMIPPGVHLDELVSPLDVVERVAIFLSIPSEWIHSTVEFMSAAPRSEVFAAAAVLFGAYACWNIKDTHNFPSVPASTWWICAAIVAQCGHPWLLPIVFIVFSVCRFIRHNDLEESMGEFIDLLIAAVLIPVIPFLLILDNSDNNADKK